MRRGEVWTAAGGKDHASKPRPVVILQDGRFETELSVTICGFTSDPTPAELLRLPITPDPDNGLMAPSIIMVDKISTVPRRKLGRRLGQLSGNDLQRLNRAVMIFLGLAGR